MKKLAMNVFGAFVFLAGSLLAAQHSSAQATSTSPLTAVDWVIGLDPDYKYAIAGEPSRRYLWILSRTPGLEEATYQEVLRLVETLGYQPGKLQKTNQSVQGS